MGILDRITGRATLREEIEKLRREIHRLRAEREVGSGPRSIVGLEDKVIQLDDQLRIEYINSPLAEELGEQREDLAGRHLSEIDRFPWAPNRLCELVQRALDAGGEGELTEELEWQNPATNKPAFYRVKVSTRGSNPQILIEDMTGIRNLEQIFARYVSPKVIEKMKQLTEHDFFRAERTELTILFADLRGFTAAAQTMLPFEVRRTINEYLEAMIDVADRHEAYVDKVVGDEVMLLFGAPIPDPDHAATSLTVAMEMIRVQDELCRRWAEAGREQLHIGIGINTGEVVVGNVGSRTRMDYTVIGHEVNVAARLCSHAKAKEVLLTESARQAVLASSMPIKDEVEFVEGGEIEAKGILEPIQVIAVRPA